MSLMLPGMYVATDTVVHRLDPRIKMGAATLLMVLPFAAPSLPSNLILSAFVLVLAALSRVPALALLRTLRAVLWLGFFMFFFYAFTGGGSSAPELPLFTWGPLSVSWAGILAGATQIYRLCLLVIVAALMSYTTSPSQLAHGLEALLSPLARVGLPIRELAMVLTISLRFVPTLSQEIDKLAKAQRARGLDPGNAPWERIQSWVPMFVPIFVSAFRRADSLATAMEARGFRGARQRTRLHQLGLGRRDLVATLIVLATTVAVLATTHLV